MLSIIKILISFPLFLKFFISFSFKKYKFKNKLKKLNEESAYKWTKKNSSYLFWLTNKKIKINNIKFWDSKPSVIFINSDNSYLPIFLIKKNNFAKQPPFIFVFEKNILLKNNYLKKFLSFTKPVYLNEKNEINWNKIVQKIKIPRTLFYFFNLKNMKHMKKIILLAANSHVKIISTKIIEEKQKQTLIFNKPILPKQLITLNYKFIKNEILKEK